MVYSMSCYDLPIKAHGYCNNNLPKNCMPSDLTAWVKPKIFVFTKISRIHCSGKRLISIVLLISQLIRFLPIPFT